MKRKKLKKLLALFLVFGMMLSLLPNMAFAAEVSDGEYPLATCTVTEGCTLEDGHDGECATVPTEDSTDGEGNDMSKVKETANLPEGNDNSLDSSVPADTESEEETEYLAEPLAANGAYTCLLYTSSSSDTAATAVRHFEKIFFICLPPNSFFSFYAPYELRR